MVESLGFWTPVKGSLIDGYFSLSGIQAEVVPGHNVDGKEGTLLIQEESSFLWTVAKVISYVTGILPLIALIAKVVFRSSYQFYKIDLRTPMEREISIPQEALQAVLSEIAEKNEHSNLTWIDQNRTIFFLNSYPGFILRTGYPLDSVDNAVRAKEKALLNTIERVTISPVKLFRLPYQNNTVSILAEKKLAVVSEDEQERLFEEEAESLTQALCELFELIYLTKWGCVNSSTIRILRDSNPKYPQERHIAVIPLWMFSENPADGIFGRRNRPKDGLISCLRSEEQITEVIYYARRCGITDTNPSTKSESEARQEVADILKLSQFHRKNGIAANPRKQLAVNLDSLGLNLQANFKTSWETRSVKNAIDHIISNLNTSIASAPETGILRDRRRFRVDVYSFEQPNTIYSSQNEPLIREIFDTLVEKGVIFQWKKMYPGLYEVQL